MSRHMLTLPRQYLDIAHLGITRHCLDISTHCLHTSIHCLDDMIMIAIENGLERKEIIYILHNGLERYVSIHS